MTVWSSFFAAMFGALVGGAISWIFHALEGRRSRRSASVAAARDVLEELGTLFPLKRDETDSYWMTKAVKKNQLRKSLFVYSALQTKRHRKLLRQEIDDVYRALEQFPSGAPINETPWLPNEGKRLILSVGEYRDQLVKLFAQIPDLRVTDLIDRMASCREEFERQQAAAEQEGD